MVSRPTAPWIIPLAVLCMGAIPEPSALLYGTLEIAGNTVSAGDDVRVYAKVPEAPDEVGSYQMGTNVNAGDLYAIQIRLESLADGSSQSANRALVGQMAQIFADGADVPNGPVLLGHFNICDRGMVVNVNLPGTIPGTVGDFDNDCDVDLDDIGPFVAVLLGLDTTPSNIVAADMDISGSADGSDIYPFVQAILNGM